MTTFRDPERALAKALKHEPRLDPISYRKAWHRAGVQWAASKERQRKRNGQ